MKHTHICFASVRSHTYPRVKPLMLWLQPQRGHRKHLTRSNQSGIKQEFSQSNLSSSYGLQPGRVSIGSKSISRCCFYLSCPFSLFFLNTYITFHCSYWLCWLLFLQMMGPNFSSHLWKWILRKSALMLCFSKMLISIMVSIQFVSVFTYHSLKWLQKRMHDTVT